MRIELMLRLMVLALLGCIFLISGLYRRRARIEKEFIKRQEEGWAALAIRLTAAFSFSAVILLDIFFPTLMSWSKIDLPSWLKILGMILATVCVLWLWWVFHTIGNNISETVLTKDSHELITSGPYRWIRHPLYAGALLLLFSLSLIFADWVVFAFALAGLLSFRLLIIPVEEDHLLEAFGEDYECYQSRTGALLPWIR